jgi:hypothetical protein
MTAFSSPAQLQTLNFKSGKTISKWEKPKENNECKPLYVRRIGFGIAIGTPEM